MIQILDARKTLKINPRVPKWKKRDLSKITCLAVHQALGTSTVVDTNAYEISPGNHIDPRGLYRIPYHFFVEKDGKVYQCNDLDDLTWTVLNKNTNVVSICAGGFYNYHDEHGKPIKGRDGDPPPTQVDATKELLIYLCNKLKLSRSAVFTHDELQGKPACPGDVLANLVKEFRNEKIS